MLLIHKRNSLTSVRLISVTKSICIDLLAVLIILITGNSVPSHTNWVIMFLWTNNEIVHPQNTISCKDCRLKNALQSRDTCQLHPHNSSTQRKLVSLSDLHSCWENQNCDQQLQFTHYVELVKLSFLL